MRPLAIAEQNHINLVMVLELQIELLQMANLHEQKYVHFENQPSTEVLVQHLALLKMETMSKMEIAESIFCKS